VCVGKSPFLVLELHLLTFVISQQLTDYKKDGHGLKIVILNLLIK
jgi:hypothetical protein